MGQPSLKLAARYRLQLSADWQSWFDEDICHVRPAGAFQTALGVEQLSVECPAEIWPGFMLPDTLPIIGNKYGDWICARVDMEGQLSELLHWYHGGGDWVPLGSCLAEALLHDVVDPFRCVGRQVLRGAVETVAPYHRSQVLDGFANPGLRQWMHRCLAKDSNLVDPVEQALGQVELRLREGDYLAALHQLHVHSWAPDAVACDLVEEALHGSNRELADPTLAKLLEMNWTPDYLRLLFDVSQFEEEERKLLLERMGHNDERWPRQDWEAANRYASSVLARRRDLGWAFDIAGWAKQRCGEYAAAAAIYFSGRHASAYSDQAVRMRTHWFDARYGKFSVAQLTELAGYIPASSRQDSYLQTVWEAPQKSMLAMVQEYWTGRGRESMRQQRYDQAYDCFYRAGWDMGAPRLGEYQRILELLIDSAQAAGWQARAALAETHLHCLTANTRRL